MTDLALDLTSIPDALKGVVTSWGSETVKEPAIADVLRANPEIAARLPTIVACSAYAADTLARYPAMLGELIESGCLDRSLRRRELDEIFSRELPVDLDQQVFMSRLRILRHRALVRIVWRDLLGAAPLEETLVELSELADAAICASLRWSTTAMTARYGVPRADNGTLSEFAVVGMGKLGGRELNLSSDVDLVFMFSEPGSTDGARSTSNEEYFRSLGQQLVGLLSKNTSDGFVYRVDVRLRPFGDSGPLAVSLPALEAYLLGHGRDWERYAYIKARVINDWSESGSLYQDILRPFVYRRYLDYGVFKSLREMKGMIEAEVSRREYQDNIKLGSGGIREIEFIVQSLQLVRGGRDVELQERELLNALPLLVAHECLPGPVATELRNAYVFLRRLENRIQAIADRQTHDVPDSELDRSRLALAMGRASWAEVDLELKQHRHAVAAHFRNIMFRGADESESRSEHSELARYWRDAASAEALGESMRNLGFADSDAALERLERFRQSSVYVQIDEPGRQRLDQLMPSLIAVAAEQTDPDQGLLHSLDVVEAIGRRSAYFALLNENPAALERLVRLCAMSRFLAHQVARHPLLLDELLDQRIFLEPPSHAEMQADLANRIAHVAPDDPEQHFDALRNFKHAATFRTAVADLSGALSLMKVSDRLTEIAELILQASVDMSWSELVPRYGIPHCRENGIDRDAQFAVIAYGKLGGLELGYGSDLDLVFLHDSAGEAQQTDAEKSTENPVFFARLTRRIIHTLTMATTSGPLYEVDTRLRPSGGSGLLVSSLVAFDRYQHKDAWTWEHQALLRSRAVAGHPRVMAAFEELRKQALISYVHRDTLRTDVLEMRKRMRDELCLGTDEDFDLKQDLGGLADIEFLVQYLVLKEAGACSELVAWSDNIRQLETLANQGVLEDSDANYLADTYRAFRQRVHRLSLAGLPRLVPRAETAEPAARVKAIWNKVFD
jgi:glutamate-ammonia-ligase adenylyltransferase